MFTRFRQTSELAPTAFSERARNWNYLTGALQMDSLSWYPGYYSNQMGKHKSISDNPTKLPRRKQRVANRILPLNEVEILGLTDAYCTQGKLIGMRHAYGQTRITTLNELQGPYASVVPTSAITSYLSYGATIRDAERGRTLQDCFAKCNEPTSDMLVSAAELLETLNMLASPLRMASNLMRKNLRSIKRLSPKRALQFASDAWLATRFGILPFVNEVNSYISSYHKFCTNRGIDRTRSTVGASQNTRSEYSGYCGSFYVTFEVVKITGWKTTSVMLYTTEFDSTLDEISQLYGLNFRSIASALWEAIPFSFVVDWVANIGTWLRVIQPSPYIKIRGNCTSFKEYERYIVTPKKIEFYPSDPYCSLGTCTESVYYTECARLRRTVGASIPKGILLNLDFMSMTHAVDSLTLIWQRMPRKWR